MWGKPAEKETSIPSHQRGSRWCHSHKGKWASLTHEPDSPWAYHFLHLQGHRISKGKLEVYRGCHTRARGIKYILVSYKQTGRESIGISLTVGGVIKTCAHVGGFVAFTQQLLVLLRLCPPVTVAVTMQKKQTNKQKNSLTSKSPWEAFYSLVVLSTFSHRQSGSRSQHVLSILKRTNIGEQARGVLTLQLRAGFASHPSSCGDAPASSSEGRWGFSGLLAG